MKKFNTKTIAFTGLFIALGLILPFLTGQIQNVGNMLLPMHIPVLLCGLICGWPAGLIAGVVTPLLRSVLFGMPPMLPVAVGMAFELAAYGAVSGLLYEKFPKKLSYTYLNLVVTMLAGRVVWGIVSFFLYKMLGNGFTWQMFLAGAFLNAAPGILIQLILIPPLMAALFRAGKRSL